MKAPVHAGALCAFALLSAGCSKSRPESPAQLHGIASTAFHGDRARLGWNDQESDLTPAAIGARGLAIIWESSPFDAVTIAGGATFAAHTYASPLYLDDVSISGGDYDGVRTSVVYAATSSGWVYAVNAAAAVVSGRSVPAGAILWRRNVGAPDMPSRNIDGVPFGVLSTPILDIAASPMRLYVASSDAAAGWQVFAIDATSGGVLPGWPVAIGSAAVEPINGNVVGGDAGNAKPTMPEHRIVSQRGALNLSPSGDMLYVPFGSYFDGATGWMVTLDTRNAKLAASFSGGASDAVAHVPADAGAGVDAGPRCPVEAAQNLGNGGMWGAGGAAVDSAGRVYMTTGNSPETSGPAAGVWGNSLLQWGPPLKLTGTYSPWNYCLLDRGDTDLGGSAPIVFDVDALHFVSFGSKQGNVYLVDRDHLAGSLAARPACDVAAPPSPASDTSLLPPGASTIFAPASRGPLNAFGPYSDGACDNQVDQAKMRSSPAFFRDAQGIAHLFVAGNSKSSQGQSVAPCLEKLRVETGSGAPYLAVDARESTLLFKNPGSPVVTSHASKDAVVWVLDTNGDRTAVLVPNPDRNYLPPRPVLYAVDADTLTPLWKSEPNQLQTGGKYNHPVIAHGVVFVATDRIQAFALR